MELTNESDAKFVKSNWCPSYFSTPDGKENTRVRFLNEASDSVRKGEQYTGVIKHVEKYQDQSKVTDSYIEEELKENFPVPCKARRFIKKVNGRDIPLNTVKICFSNEEQYEKAMTTGVYIGRCHFKVEELQSKPRIMQCFRCNKFDHPIFQCTEKIRCRYCAGQHHEDYCKMGDDTRLRCSNCKGNHAATSTICPDYIRRKEEKLQRINRHE